MESIFNLKGKTALITGASSGIGAHFARTLSSAGARVILAARRIESLEILAQELGDARAVSLDVANLASVQQCFSTLESFGEKIDICVNSAGMLAITPIFAEADDFATIVQTNLVGLWYVTKAVANHMQSHQIQGSIINLASVNGANRLRPGIAAYAAAKAGVIQMTKALVGELALHGIRINCICPGLIHTPLNDERLQTKAQKDGIKSTIPLGFIAQPEALDGALLLLASKQASAYMTGSCVTIDGGVSWGGAS